MMSLDSIGQVMQLHYLSSYCNYNTVDFIIENILSGGMGRCLKIKHIETNEYYCIKVPNNKLIQTNEDLKLFGNEVINTIQLSNHESIVEVQLALIINEIPCLCLKWMENGSLRQAIKNNIDFDLEKTVYRIVQGLEWAWAKHKIVHRDLKPENILFDVEYNAVISDWGISVQNAEHSTYEITKSDTKTIGDYFFKFEGTPHYASPEQIRGENLDLRSDIYSLGCMLYEINYGKLPFNASTPKRIIELHLEGKTDFPNQGRYNLKSIIQKCLIKDKMYRYQSYDELICDFEKTNHSSRLSLGERSVPDHLKNIFKSYSDLTTYKKTLSGMGSGIYLKTLKSLYELKSFTIKCSDSNWNQSSYFELYALYCMVKTGYYEDDEEVCEIDTRWIKLNSFKNKPAEFYIKYSSFLIIKGDYKKSEEVIKEGLSSFPKDLTLLANLVDVYRAQKNFTEALQTIKIVLSENYSVSEAYITSLAIYEFADSIEYSNWKDAIQYFKNIILILESAGKIKNTVARINFLKALCYCKLFKYDQAIQIINSSISSWLTNKTNLNSVLLLADILVLNKDYSSCLDLTNRWIEILLDRNIVSSRLNPKLEVCQSDELPNQILTVYRDQYIDKFNIRKSMCLFHRACADSKQEYNIKAAINFFQSLYERDVLRPVDICFLTELLLFNNQYADAYRLLLEAGEKKKYYKYEILKSSMLAKYKQYDHAIEGAINASKLAPSHPEPLHMLSTIYHLAGLDDLSISAKWKAEQLYLIQLECTALN